MSRPWKIWALFALCVAVLLAAMGWVSLTTLRLDTAQWRANQQAELEERVRLALWRLDSWLVPLMVEESARPANAYEAFHPAERAFVKGAPGVRQGDVLVPSPLLTYAASNVLLHFQFAPGGPLTSPQVPTGSQRDLAENGYTTRDRIAAAAARLAELQRVLNERAPADPGTSSSLAASLSGTKSARPMALRNGDVLVRQTALPVTNTVQIAQVPALAMNNEVRQSKESQQLRNSVELNARANFYQQAQQQAIVANQQPAQSDFPPQAEPVNEGLFKPVWLGNVLVLARRVNAGGGFAIQGCWLNWPNLKQSLLASVRDLFPAADLQPITAPNGEREPRKLAALPVALATGPVGFEAIPVWTPVRISLAVAWTCVLLAALAVAALLHGAVSLSERRGAFVSAVTHELRTPLTTFKMYSEMLAEGMVQDADKRRHYLTTLCSEANRLSHLVENVLAYARLERGSARRNVAKVTLGELIQRVEPRLRERARQADLELAVDSEPEALRTLVHVDVSAVEQILFNLVDNACKYAAPAASERVIHLEALPEGKFAMLRVRDHGQGISPEGARRLFRPFSKSAHEAARTAPGVGLGLALCRRLSRSMGGDLRLDQAVKGGACFVLTLPISTGGDAAPASIA